MEPRRTPPAVEAGPNGVAIVRAEAAGALAELDPDAVRALFERTGAIWFRGFRADARSYFEFINQFARELITLNSWERTRHREVEELQSVTGGFEALPFHTEMGHIPKRPDFLSFWCEQPAKRGGETLLLDGVALWRALSEETRRIFRERRVRYLTLVPEGWWRDRVASGDPAEIARAWADVPDISVEVAEDRSLIIDWRTHAVFRPRFGEELSIASSLFAYVVPGMRVSFEGGSPISAEIQEELARASGDLTAEIAWSPGELVLFDNTRWLHGRREVVGYSRRVQMLQGYLR